MASIPSVAVIVAARDAESTIAQALRSALDQSLPPSEVVVVSDGSVDRTAEIARVTLQGRGKVLELRQSVGRAAARNMAVEATDSDFLLICDADDVSHPERVSRLMACARLVDAQVVGGQALLLNKRGLVFGVTSMPTSARACRDLAEAGKMPVIHPSCLIRTTAFKRVGGYDVELKRSQDLHLMIRLTEIGALIVNSPEVVVAYRYPLLVPFKRYCEEHEWANMARAAAGLTLMPRASCPQWIELNARRIVRASRFACSPGRRQAGMHEARRMSL